MAKADRLARLDERRLDLEGEYHAALVAALRATAAGQWGLFDHKPDKAARKAVAPVIAHLADLGEQIDAARETLGLPAYELQQRFLAARGPAPAHAVGEPKQAQAWLAQLES